jgi:division protein 1
MEIGRLRGHAGTVKCLQVEDHVCLTGGDDGNVRLWDLRRVEQSGDWEGEGELVGLSDVAEEGESADNDRDPEIDVPTGIRSGNAKQSAGREDPCARLLEGHTKAVTALYFEDDCLVRPPLHHIRR